MNLPRRFSLLVVVPLVCLFAVWMVQCNGGPPDVLEELTCDLTYDLPADVSTQTQMAFDEYSWKSFLALNAPRVGGRVSTTGDNPTQWAAWSSTADLLDQGSDPGPSGSRYYPAECRNVPNYQNYRVLDQVGKVDDSFEEAKSQGLSANPVVASNGTFVRYEILLSPATYNWVVGEGLNKVDTLVAWAEAGSEVNFQCGMPTYTGGNPADTLMGAIVLKNAWMEMDGFNTADYHTDSLLVYTPGYRNSTGTATCELKTMGLVGMHIAHKTLSQPNWTWSTFEHANNAPDCTALPDNGDGSGDNGPSNACPASVTQEWNFFGTACNSGGACQTCNVAPDSNATVAGQCVNPSNPTSTPWCLDRPPNPKQGLSRLCRQFPVAANYPSADSLNTRCEAALGSGVWSNYQLISTQWFPQTPPTTCTTNQTTITTTDPVPKTDVMGVSSIDTTVTPHDTTFARRPFLGNTSMESYERSNCTACHSKGYQTQFQMQGDTSHYTIVNDFMYWLVLEVPAANNR